MPEPIFSQPERPLVASNDDIAANGMIASSDEDFKTSHGPYEVEHDQVTDAHNNRMRNIAGAVIGAGAVASWIFEIGPANEALRTNIALDVLENTSSPNAVATTLTAVTMGIEVGAATLVAGGFHFSGDKIIDKVRRFKFIDKKFKEIEEKQSEMDGKGKVASVSEDALTSLGFGAAIVVARHYFKDKLRGRQHVLSRNILKGVAAATPPALMTGAVGKIASETIIAGGEADLGPVSEFIVDYGTNNAFWMGALGSMMALKYGYSKVRDRKDITSQEHSVTHDQLVDSGVQQGSFLNEALIVEGNVSS